MKTYTILCLFLLLFFRLSAQERKVIPPSPNASSLGTYGDIPVGHYTGVPNINIPLYEIESGNIKVPISLSYHAAGIKVAQEASWVGLGWSLNAGGIITRSIRGWDDLRTGDQYNPVGYPSGLDLPSDANYTIDINGNEAINARYVRYAENEEDSEPDIFYYNFGNYSGKILLRKGKIPVILNQDPLQIEQFNGSCIIRTPDGNAYYFGTTEESSIYNHLLASNTRILREIQPYVTNSWYLDSIVSPHNDKVIFRYKKNSRRIRNQLAATNSVFLDAPEGDTGVHWWVYTDTAPFTFYGYTSDSPSHLSFSETVVDEVLLEEIIFREGRVRFSTTGRTDLIVDNPADTIPQRLDEIAIYNDLDTINLYQFNTSYFQSTNGTTADQNRLRLDQITDLAGRQYSFTYNGESLPKKTSSSVDHWGLYNGANNEVFDDYAAIPNIDVWYSYIHFIYAGANREASSVKSKAAILTRIDYPTGGYSEFDYELNDYITSYETIGYENVSNSLNGGNSQTINLESITGITFQFTFTKNQSGCLWEGSVCDSLGRSDCYTPYLELQKKQSGGTWVTQEQLLYRNLDCFDGESLTYSINRTLSAGEYNIIVNSFETLGVVCNYRYAYHPLIANNKGGGLRVKEIETSDGENINTTSYIYTMPSESGNQILSSGILMSKPQYHFTITSPACDTLGMIDGSSCSMDLNFSAIGYTKATSETIIPMGTSAQGNPVGYSQVTEIRQSAESNGKTIYYFSNNQEYGFPLDSLYSTTFNPPSLMFSGVPNFTYQTNGNLLKKEYWNSSSQLVKEENYVYEKADSVFNVRGVKLYSLGSIAFWEDQYGNTEPSKANYLIRFYDNISERWNLVKDSTITYDRSVSPALEINQVNHYSYDNHTQLIRKTTQNSDGATLESKIRYPYDINIGVYASMDTLNMINYPIEQTTLVDNQITGSTLTTYKSGGGSYVPDKIYSVETTSPLSSFTYFNGTTKDSHYSTTAETEFVNYDSSGNVIKVSKKDGTYTYYIWGYNKTLPVAKMESIVNYTSTLPVVNDNSLSRSDVHSSVISDVSYLEGLLSSFISNTSYRVTLYTYKPLVGMTSQTDPTGVTTYYEYDSFGRLSLVKNDDEKLLNKYEYNYAH